jgi:hypothetical protein
MATDEAPDWAKREVQEAIRILKEDGLHVHKTYAAFMSSQTTEDDTPPKEETTEGKPPPAKTETTEKPVKKGVWWSDRTND